MAATSESGRRPSRFSICSLGLAADDRLEIAHHLRIGMRAGDRADAVEGVLDIGHPVAQRLVHRVLQRARAGLGRERPRRPAASCGRRWASAARCRLRPCRRCIRRPKRAQAVAVATPCWPAPVSAMMRFLPMRRASRIWPMHVVDLVRAGVVQLVALEIDLGAAEMLGQALGEIERAGPADIMFEEAVELGLEARVGLGVLVGLLELAGSAASAFRRRSGRHRCRRGRSRPGRCGRNWERVTFIVAA